jgi:hypothetical protein
MNTIETKKTDEVIPVKFDYAFEADGVAITAQVITVTRLSGTADPSPGDTIAGLPPQVTGSVVLQLMKNGIAGTRYKLHCLATFADGRKLARDYLCDVVAP